MTNKTEWGYNLSVIKNIKLSHYEREGRNERLESVLNTMLIENYRRLYLLDCIKAIHDHKGCLRILVKDDTNEWNIRDVLSVFRELWDAHEELADDVYVYFRDRRIFQECSTLRIDNADEFYQGIRYDLSKVEYPEMIFKTNENRCPAQDYIEKKKIDWIKDNKLGRRCSDLHKLFKLAIVGKEKRGRWDVNCYREDVILLAVQQLSFEE